MRYRLLDDGGVHNNETGGYIPKDEANTDYQEYLEWVAEGNEAEEWVNE